MMNNKNYIEGVEFVSLITSHQRRIFAYIITLVPNRSDAEDIMQETSALMWEKKNDFRPGSDFVAWGARIAYYKILDYRKKVNKNRRMVIKEGQFKRIEERAIENSKHVDDMINKLDECMKKLSTSDRQLISMKYSAEMNVKEISSRIKKTVRSVYLAISRIQGLLLRCIEGYDA